MHDAHDHGIGRAGCGQPERTTMGCGDQGEVGTLNEFERALLAEIAAMTSRLCHEVEGLRADIAELSESSTPDPAALSVLRRPA